MGWDGMGRGFPENTESMCRVGRDAGEKSPSSSEVGSGYSFDRDPAHVWDLALLESARRHRLIGGGKGGSWRQPVPFQKRRCARAMTDATCKPGRDAAPHSDAYCSLHFALDKNNSADKPGGDKKNQKEAKTTELPLFPRSATVDRTPGYTHI